MVCPAVSATFQKMSWSVSPALSVTIPASIFSVIRPEGAGVISKFLIITAFCSPMRVSIWYWPGAMINSGAASELVRGGISFVSFDRMR